MVIGWNAINIGILAAVVTSQLRSEAEDWAERLQGVFSKATTMYWAWAVFLLVAIPLLFR
jgi:hypothetical protein